MKLQNLPADATTWAQLPAAVMSGRAGTATARTRKLGEITLRLVDYSPGYVADHWCSKGHIVLVVDGALAIEHDDGRRFSLTSGMSWHVGDDECPPHRVVSEAGARVFIID
jgi:hypothetical protein